MNIQAAQLSEDAEGPSATILLRLDRDVPADYLPTAGAARFEAKLQKSGQLNVAMTIVGVMVADRVSVEPTELQIGMPVVPVFTDHPEAGVTLLRYTAQR